MTQRLNLVRLKRPCTRCPEKFTPTGTTQRLCGNCLAKATQWRKK